MLLCLNCMSGDKQFISTCAHMFQMCRHGWGNSRYQEGQKLVVLFWRRSSEGPPAMHADLQMRSCSERKVRLHKGI